jgi:hypothetical protein
MGIVPVESSRTSPRFRKSDAGDFEVDFEDDFEDDFKDDFEDDFEEDFKDGDGETRSRPTTASGATGANFGRVVLGSGSGSGSVRASGKSRAAFLASRHKARTLETHAARFDVGSTSSPMGTIREPIGNAGRGSRGDAETKPSIASIALIASMDALVFPGLPRATASTNRAWTFSFISSSFSTHASIDNESLVPASSLGRSRRRSFRAVSSQARSAAAA